MAKLTPIDPQGGPTEIHSLIDEIEKYAKGCGLDIQKKESHSITVWTTPYIGLQVRIWIDDKDFFYFDFYNRTYSHFYNGERTDLHDIFSVFFATFVKSLGICSVSFVNIYNPATGSDCEIYANYIIPVQINQGLIHVNTLDKSLLQTLISSLFIFEQSVWDWFKGCPCSHCRARLGYKFDYQWKTIHPKRIEKAMRVIGSNNLVNYCERTLPTWFYYRNFKRKVTLIESKDIIYFIQALTTGNDEVIKGVEGELILSGDFHHFLSSRVKNKISKYFQLLKDTSPQIMLFESKVLAVGKRYILAIDEGCGVNDFKIEREKIRERHDREFNLLFKPSKITWNESIDYAVFENLIKDLLEREPNVTRVRKLSHTNERDSGADLIAEWLVPKTNREKVTRGEQPYKKINVIVQCKALRNGLGKSDVQDIRDTVELRNYGGYFLATSTHTKKSLSDHLDKIRTDGKIWLDWWTSVEIEEKIKKHLDLIIKYNSIFTTEVTPKL